MTKEIHLRCGSIAIVDDEDYDRVKDYKWYSRELRPGKVYVCAYTGGGQRASDSFLHRFVLNAERGQIVDHKDGNPLNNVRENLRLATRQENQRNRGPQRGRKYKGVRQSGQRFTASIVVDRKHISLGTYATDVEAAQAYNAGALQYFGEFAWLNPIK